MDFLDCECGRFSISDPQQVILLAKSSPKAMLSARFNPVVIPQRRPLRSRGWQGY